MAWQLQSLEALTSAQSIDTTQAEQGSIELSQFLTQAPTDFLEPLLDSQFGRVYKIFLERCCTAKFSGSAAENRSNELSQKLRQVGCETPEGWAVLLALFPFFPPKQLKVEDASSKLPSWLHTIYSNRYEAPENHSFHSPTGNTAFEDRNFLNRILGLSNLYYIDPEDQEILKELREIRLQTVDLMLSVGREDLSRQFRSDFGDRFWAMAQSGVQKEELNANEIQRRDSMQQWLSNTPNSLHQDGGIQRFAAVLLTLRACGFQIQTVTCRAGLRRLQTLCSYKPAFATVRILFVHCNYLAIFAI